MGSFFVFMKLNKRTENILLFLFVTLPDKLLDGISTLVKIFTKLYLFGLIILWIGALYFAIINNSFDLFTIVFLIFTFIGFGALSSYVEYRPVATVNFWRAMLFIMPIGYLLVSPSFAVAILVLICMFPTLYAFYKIGFDNGEYELFCLIKRTNQAKIDAGIKQYMESEEYTQLSSLKKTVRLMEFRMLKFTF